MRSAPLPTPRPGSYARDGAFFAALAGTCNVTAACRLAKISRNVVYDRRDKDPEFARKWDEAWRLGAGRLEDEATRRATYGTEKPVYYKGHKVGAITEYSDRLLELRLRAELPEKYRERGETKHVGPGGGPVRIDVSQLSTAQIMAILAADGEGGAEGGAGEAEPGE